MRVLVTGGAGFIGSAVCRYAVLHEGWQVLNIDALTYAANLQSLDPIADSAKYKFAKVNICDGPTVERFFLDFAPDAVIHLAAETHVDRSINEPAEFIRTNVMGTHVLLECARTYWDQLPASRREKFRFLHVSTDEVYGSLGPTGRFSESTPYDPRSPYSASKASSDHLVRAWYETYGLPTLISNCSNNYGPYQFPEKLIPMTILNALDDLPLPVYGDGQNVRDWLYVDDHVRGLIAILTRGRAGEKYNIGGSNERSNIAVVHQICDILDELMPRRQSRRDLVSFVADRPGHDRRYAIDAGKITRELGWTPDHNFDVGLRKTIQWYIDNPSWWRPLRNNVYRGERLGLIGA